MYSDLCWNFRSLKASLLYVNLLCSYMQKRDLKLEPEEQRLLDRLLRDGKRNGLIFKLFFTADWLMVFLGLHLSTELQDKVKELKKKLTQLEIEFSKNLSEEKSSFEFSEGELSKDSYNGVSV